MPRRKAADFLLPDKAFNIARNPRYNRYQHGLTSLVYKYFDKKSSGSGVRNEIMQSQEIAEELHDQTIKKFEKLKVYSSIFWVPILRICN